MPTSISEISQPATSFLTNIDAEEETLPKNPRDLLEITILNANPEHPDLQYSPDDITISNTALATDCHSSQIQNAKTAKAAGAPSWLDKVQQEVAKSKARVEEARVEKKQERLEDVREDERRNDPAKLDEAAKEEM